MATSRHAYLHTISANAVTLKRLIDAETLSMSKVVWDFSCTQSSNHLNVGHIAIYNNGEFAPATFWILGQIHT